MAVATVITRPEEAVEMLADILDDNAGLLGLEFVGRYDEKLLPRYPAVVVSGGTLNKEVHGTHTFLTRLRCVLWVYHANANQTHAQRSREDLELATALVALLEDDKTFDNRVVFGYVESETPGVIAARTGRSELIVGTRLVWEAVTRHVWS